MDSPQHNETKKTSLIRRYLDRPKSERLPVFAWVFYGLGLLALIFSILFSCFPNFAYGYNHTIGQGLRMILSILTIWIPFSLCELLILLLPILIVIFSIKTMKKNFTTWRQSIAYSLAILSIIPLIFSSLTFVFAAGYKSPGVETKMDLERSPVDAAKLESTAIILRDKINNLVDSGQIVFGEDHFSVNPSSWNEMNTTLLLAYRKAAVKYDFIQTFPSQIKPIMLSPVLTYTHIAGIYTYITGEVNINYHYPDYVCPFSAAHEMAHQRGFAREDEANFVAFLVAMEAEDPYIRYSALVNCYEYVNAALYRADKDRYQAEVATLNLLTKDEFIAYDSFFTKYENSPASTVSSALSGIAQSAQGVTPNSYGLMVDLLVAYYEKN